MKVLFVSSGNSGRPSIIVRRQAISLEKAGIELEYFSVQGKGIKGYIRNIKPLRKLLESKKYDLVHAHYSLSAYVASIAGAKPLIVSLMGSDVNSLNMSKFVIKLFKLLFSWKSVIVKSESLKMKTGFNCAVVIPNGVDLAEFNPINKLECKKKLNLNPQKVNILFAADPSRPEKNYSLAKNAFKIANRGDLVLHVLKGITPHEVNIWYNAADIVLLTSLWEGSPNVIKEAMACNTPVVTTRVGDVEWLFGNSPGHFISDHSIQELSDKLMEAVEYIRECQYSTGRQRILELQLDSDTVAERIIQIYKLTLLG